MRKRRRRVSRSAARRRNRKRKPSSIEVLVASWLTEDNVSFKTEYAVGKCHVDILLGETTVLELQGCYYHACTRCNLRSKRKTRSKTRQDSNRFRFLESMGYKVYPIWECDLEKKPEETREYIRELAKCPSVDSQSPSVGLVSS